LRKEAGGDDNKEAVSEYAPRAKKTGVGAIATESKLTRQRASTADENCTSRTQELFNSLAPVGQHAEFIVAPS
jgi:hypothetical protein